MSDETCCEALEESRQLDEFISKVFEERKREGQNSLKLCISHEHRRIPNPKATSCSPSSALIEPVAPAQGHSHYYACCCKGCLHTSRSSNLYPFPDNARQASVWLERCGLSHLRPFIDSTGSVPKNYLLCENHFMENQFDGSTGKKLVGHAMPTVFPPQNASSQPSISNANSLDSSCVKVSKLKIVAPDKNLVMKSLSCHATLNLQRLDSRSISPKFCKLNGIGFASAALCKRKMNQWERDKCDFRCAYSKCTGGPTLHRFPSSKSRCNAWIANCGRDKLPPSLLSCPIPLRFSRYRLCSKHFDPSYFCSNKIDWANTATPTLFPHNTATPTLFPHSQDKNSPLGKKFVAVNSSGGNAVEVSDYSNDRKSSDAIESSSLPYVVFKRKSSNVSSHFSSSSEDSSDDERSVPSAPKSVDSLGISLPLNSSSKMCSANKSILTCLDEETQQRIDKLQRQYKRPGESLSDVQKDIAFLEEEYRRLKEFAKCLSQRKLRCVRSVQSLSSCSLYKCSFSVQQAFDFIKSQLKEGLVQFFMCQRMDRINKHWSLDSLEIPFIANRCGLGAREALSTLFKMPCKRTLSRYRRLLRRNPNKLPASSIVHQDVRKAYHRTLTRKKHSRSSSGFKSISDIIISYVKKNEEPSDGDHKSACAGIESQSSAQKLSDDMFLLAQNDDSYHHKKYDVPQKWR